MATVKSSTSFGFTRAETPPVPLKPAKRRGGLFLSFGPKPAAPALGFPSGRREPASNPLVTVGIPAYNRPELLRETLASLAAQTDFDDFEVVVSDDLALPETRAVVEASGLRQVRLYVNPQPLGAVGNWNRCLELGKGEWMMILHEDDLLYPWYFSTVIPRLRSTLSAISMKCAHGQTPTTPPAPADAGKVRRYHSSCFIKSAMTPFPGVLFPRELATRIGGFDEGWGPLADYDFWYRLACSGEVETLGSLGAFYRESQGQWTSAVWPEMLRKNHLLRLRVAREQFPGCPRLGRWLARFFTYRNARAYSRRFSQRPPGLVRALKFGGWRERILPSGWAWLLVQRLPRPRSIAAC